MSCEYLHTFDFFFRYQKDELHGASTWVELNATRGRFEFESLHVGGGSHLVFEDGAQQDTPFAVDIGTVFSDTTGQSDGGEGRREIEREKDCVQ